MAKKPWEVERHPCSTTACTVHVPRGLDSGLINKLMARLQLLTGVRSTAYITDECIECGVQDPTVLNHITAEVSSFTRAEGLVPALT